MTALSGILAHDVPKIWPHVAEMIADGLTSRGAAANLDPIYGELCDGVRQLWLATSQGRGIEALLMTKIEKDKRGKFCALKLLVGEEPGRWLHLLEKIEAWAAENGCFMVTTEWTRTGWEKLLPDYQPKRVWLEKELKDER